MPRRRRRPRRARRGVALHASYADSARRHRRSIAFSSLRNARPTSRPGRPSESCTTAGRPRSAARRRFGRAACAAPEVEEEERVLHRPFRIGRGRPTPSSRRPAATGRTCCRSLSAASPASPRRARPRPTARARSPSASPSGGNAAGSRARARSSSAAQRTGSAQSGPSIARFDPIDESRETGDRRVRKARSRRMRQRSVVSGSTRAGSVAATRGRHGRVGVVPVRIARGTPRPSRARSSTRAAGSSGCTARRRRRRRARGRAAVRAEMQRRAHRAVVHRIVVPDERRAAAERRGPGPRVVGA